MKESISATTLFQLVILFILLFTAIMCLTINNSNAFGVKDEIVNVIELSKGNFFDSDGSLSEEITETMTQATYRTTGDCSKYDGYVGYRKDGTPVSSNEKASICIREVNVTDEIDSYIESLFPGKVATNDFIKGKYYQIVVFYQLDMPILNNSYNMSSKGETRIIYE